MSLRYLPEHAEKALLALELARKEAAHLQYTHRTLFALPIDAAWVQRLASRDELAEKARGFRQSFRPTPGPPWRKTDSSFCRLVRRSA